MTIEVTTRRIPFYPNGNVGPHTFPFRALDKDQIKAYRFNPAVDVAPVLLTQGSGTNEYQVSINTRTEGGSVTLGATLATTFTGTDPVTGIRLIIEREVDDKQKDSFPTASPFPEKAIDNALDKLTMRDIQIAEEVGRAIKIPATTAGSGFEGTIQGILTAGAVLSITPDLLGVKVSQTNIDDLDAAVAQTASNAALAVSSATQAATSEANADASEALAQKWAENPENSEVVTGSFSALHWAKKAAASVGNIATQRIRGRVSAGTGPEEQLTITQVLDMVGGAVNGDILQRIGGAWTRLAAGSALQVIRRNAANTSLEYFTPVGVLPDVIVEDQRAQNTTGGIHTATTWVARTLNTLVRNTIGATLGSNQLTLPAGTYYMEAQGIHGCQSNGAILVIERIRNMTDGVTVGGGGVTAGGSLTNRWSNFTTTAERTITCAPVVIAAPKAFSLEYFASGAVGTSDLGWPLNSAGILEVYANLKVWKIA